MTEFQYLPVEILIKISECVVSNRSACLASLSAVSRKLRNIFQPILYQTWTYEAGYPLGTREPDAFNSSVFLTVQDLKSRRLESFVRTLEKRSDLALHLHTFELSTREWDTNGRSITLVDVNEIVVSYEDVRNHIGKILTLARNLKSLAVAYPRNSTFLNITIPSLEVLEIRTWVFAFMTYELGNGRWIEDLYLPLSYEANISFLHTLLKSSMLKTLNLQAYMIVRNDEPVQQLPLVPSLKEILIDTKSIGTTTICWLIKSAPLLERFDFRLLEQEPEDTLWFNNHRVCICPNFTAVIYTLSVCSEMIRHLVLQYPCERRHEQQVLPQITFESFHHLEYLDIDEYILFGWWPCQHELTLGERPNPRGPERVADLLPSSLKMMELRLDILYNIRYGVGHAFKIVSSLLQRRDHLSEFNRLTFHFPRLYCKLCEEFQEDAARAAPPTNPLIPVYGVDLTEASQIKSLMSLQEKSFDIRYREDPIHWIGAADGHY